MQYIVCKTVSKFYVLKQNQLTTKALGSRFSAVPAHQFKMKETRHILNKMGCRPEVAENISGILFSINIARASKTANSYCITRVMKSGLLIYLIYKQTLTSKKYSFAM